MTPRDGRRWALALTIVALACALLAIPIEFGRRDDKLMLTAALVRAAGAESLVISAPVMLLDAPRLAIESGTVTVATIRTLTGGGRFETLLEQGRVRLSVENATLSLGPGPSAGAGGEVPEGQTLAPILAALADLRFEGLSVRGATIVRRGPDGTRSHLGTLSAEVALKPRTSLSAKGAFERNGRTLAFETVLTLPASRKAASTVPVRARLTGPMLTADIGGQITRGGVLQVSAQKADIRVPDLKQLAAWLGLAELDVPGFRELTAKGEMDWTGTSVSFQSARFTLDGNVMSGGLAIDVGGKRPMIDGTLAFDKLDVSPYLSSASAFALATSWLSPQPSTPHRLAALIEHLDADLRVSAAHVLNGGSRVGSGAATLEMKGGRLNASIMELALESGGRGQGQIIIDLRGPLPRYGLGGELSAVDAARAGTPLLGRLVSEGRLSVAGNIAIAGRTAAELLSSVDGHLNVSAANGAVIGLDLESLMEQPRTAGSKGWGDVLSASTPVEALVLKLNADTGRLTTEVVNATTPGTRYTAAGTLDASSRTIDVTVTRSATERPATSHGAPRSTAVRIQGLLDAPEVTSARSGDRADTPLARLPPG